VHGQVERGGRGAEVKTTGRFPENARIEGSLVCHKVAESKEGNCGFNAATDEYGDMVKMLSYSQLM
jgi:hypothetical protein